MAGGWRPALAVVGLLLAAGGVAARGGAVDAPGPGWTVLHCGVANGVLYLTYAENGRAAITPAVDNAALRAACAKAGYPLNGARSGRVAQPPLAIEPPGPAALPAARPVPAPAASTAVAPTFTAQAVGSTLSIDARNDGAAPQSCLLSYTWTWDDNPAAPRSATTQVTLPGRQSQRVVHLSIPGIGARFLTAPNAVCRALP